MKTGIIIPCYNEENRLQKDQFISFIKSHINFHLCFVNDGSKDGTLGVLKSLQQESPKNISIVDVKKNNGKAAAVRAGVRYLYQRKDIAQIGFIDADLSTDFNDFKALVKKLKSSEDLLMVFGSRNQGGNNIKRDIFRNGCSNIIKCFISMILGLPIADTQCGAKVFTREIAPVMFSNSFKTKWLFDVEMFLKLKKYFGRKNVMNYIKEQPLQKWIHADDSKLGLKDALKMPLKLIAFWYNYNVLGQFELVQQDLAFETVNESLENIIATAA